MSDPGSEDRNNQQSAQTSLSPSSREQAADGYNDSTGVPNVMERRRLQNRLAQRNHRMEFLVLWLWYIITLDIGRKVREHISALETQLVDNILLGTSLASLQTPSSPASHSSMFLPTTRSSDSQSNQSNQPIQSIESIQSNQALDQMFDFPLNFPEDMDQISTSPSASQSASQASPRGYPPSTINCASMCTRCTSCLETQESSTPGSMGEAFNEFHASPPSQPNQRAQSPSFLDATTYRQGVECYTNPGVVFVMGPPQHSTPGPQIPLGQLRSGSEGSTPIFYHAPHVQPHTQPRQQPTLVSQYPGAISMPIPIPCKQSAVP
jgi:hypothetical protein